MKLVKFGSFLAAFFILVWTLIILILLKDIVGTKSNDHDFDLYDSWQPWFRSQFPAFKSTLWRTVNGAPSMFSYVTVAALAIVIGIIICVPPAIRAKHIEMGVTKRRGLIYLWGILCIITGGLLIPGIFMIVGAFTDVSEVGNAERSYDNERIYGRQLYSYDYDNQSRYNRSSELEDRIEGLEKEIDYLHKRSRKNRYDIDDELEYMNRRNNRKFEDIEDDIDDLYEETRRGRRSY